MVIRISDKTQNYSKVTKLLVKPNQNYINNIFKVHIKQFYFYSPCLRFHNLRDTYATLMLKNGCDIFTLKKLLGHSSFSSTSRYIKYDDSDLAQAPVLSSLMGIK